MYKVNGKKGVSDKRGVIKWKHPRLQAELILRESRLHRISNLHKIQHAESSDRIALVFGGHKDYGRGQLKQTDGASLKASSHL